ncbi:MAG TPA: hypothetical protein VF463_11110 [Sphingobium sp.]
MPNPTLRKSCSLALLGVLLALAACGKKPHEEPVQNEETIEEPDNVTVEEVNPAAPPAAETNSAKPVENRVAPPEVSEEQQMQDDAEASGMTSRLPDDESASAAASGTPR